jgi:hypothetical protein
MIKNDNAELVDVKENISGVIPVYKNEDCLYERSIFFLATIRVLSSVNLGLEIGRTRTVYGLLALAFMVLAGWLFRR